jgi:hypothetical protein
MQYDYIERFYDAGLDADGGRAVGIALYLRATDPTGRRWVHPGSAANLTRRGNDSQGPTFWEAPGLRESFAAYVREWQQGEHVHQVNEWEPAHV